MTPSFLALTRNLEPLTLKFYTTQIKNYNYEKVFYYRLAKHQCFCNGTG